MLSRPVREEPWFGVTVDHFRTRGADVQRGHGGWFIRIGKRLRGPISSLGPALDAAERMLAEDAKRGDV